MNFTYNGTERSARYTWAQGGPRVAGTTSWGGYPTATRTTSVEATATEGGDGGLPFDFRDSSGGGRLRIMWGLVVGLLAFGLVVGGWV